MSRRTLIGGLIAASSIGLIVALVTADSGVLSFEVWLGAALVWLGLALALQVTAALPAVSTTWRPIWERKQVEDPDVRRPAILAATDQVVAGALRRGRAFDTRLRPRLIALFADTAVTSTDPDTAFWIMDERVQERTPTLAELSAILDELESHP